MASGQGDIAATARRFLEEMGQIGPALNAFTEKWRDSATIVQNWPNFRSETREIFEALATRIHCENNELYPLADEMTSYSWPGRSVKLASQLPVRLLSAHPATTAFGS